MDEAKLEKLQVKEIIQAVNGTLQRGNEDDFIDGVSIDTRTLQKGDLFFALTGENTDGHQYVTKAIESGAGGVVVSELSAVPQDIQGSAVIHVADPLWALGELAKYYRSKFNIRVIGITGSLGKTTTKEMLAGILEKKWKVLKNQANFNNEIGLPLTLFQLNKEHEIAILEMAMRGLGEIQRLASIARPSYGIITNIGISHIERLGSQGSIADAKAELLTELPEDGVAILNAEDCYFAVMKNRFQGRVVSFGSCNDADVIGTRIKCNNMGCHSFLLMIQGEAIQINMPVLGYHNVYNALAASAAAVELGVDFYTIRDALQNITPPSMRMEFFKTNKGFAVLNDAYNAGPASMIAALRTLSTLKGYKRKIAVLGDMLELGAYSTKAHKDIGVSLPECGLSILITVGDLANGIANGAKEAGFPIEAIQSYPDSIQAGKMLKEQVKKGDAILIKGSRAIKMEEIVRMLQDD